MTCYVWEPWVDYEIKNRLINNCLWLKLIVATDYKQFQGNLIFKHLLFGNPLYF